jgi:hypothetical protein
MGLDISHDCWHGGYSLFLRWRCEIARVAGIDLMNMDGYAKSGGIKWESLKPDVLHVLLNHSDCDGYIQWRYTKKLADRLTELLPLLEDESYGSTPSCRSQTEPFIEGLLRAYEAHERVEFY